MAQVEIVVDKMHIHGHTCCKENCDTSAFSQLDKVRINEQ